MAGMTWQLSNRADPRAREIADRHYNRQKPGTQQFVPPGRCLVLYAETQTGKALWVTSWQYPQYAIHAWPGAWVCSAFRNEGAGVASQLIQEAVAVTREYFGVPPPLGMITFIDRRKVKPTMVHGAKTWGYTYKLAGFREVGETKGGLLALQLQPDHMPVAQMPIGRQLTLFCSELGGGGGVCLHSAQGTGEGKK